MKKFNHSDLDILEGRGLLEELVENTANKIYKKPIDRA